ncbi:MAG: hypothetical protein LH628_09915 [Microcoleus sp. CAN_BIN18]|nr:hypothetical protein [Microcoleus sp. CAN_BIN18]
MQVFGRKTRFLGGWLGLEKPGFYGDLGLFAEYLGEKPGFWVSGWGLEKPGFYGDLGLFASISEKTRFLV